MAQVKYTKDWVHLPGQPYRPPQEKATVGKTAASAFSAVQKSLSTLDKVHEVKLGNSGLLDDKQWSFQVEDPNTVTGVRNVDMFTRADYDAKINPVSYFKNTTRSTFKRIKPTPEALSKYGVRGLEEQLTGQGFKRNEIVDILSQGEGVEVLPFADEAGRPFDYGLTELKRNQIIGKAPSKISQSLDKVESFFSEGVEKAKSTQFIKAAGKDLGKFGKDSINELKELSRDVAKHGKVGFGKLQEFGDEVSEVSQKLGKISLDVLDNLGDKAVELGKIGMEKLFLEGTRKTAEKAARKMAEEAAKKAAEEAAKKAAEKAAGEAAEAIGTTAAEGAAKGITKAIPGISAVVSLKDVPKGAKRMHAGNVQIMESLQNIGKEGGENITKNIAGVVKGYEEGLQGSLDVAGPALPFMGPPGWIAQAGSAVEDVLMDEGGPLEWMQPWEWLS